MSVPVIVLGESGSGKSTALRNLPSDNTLLLQAIAKPLPFKTDKWQVYDAAAKKGNIFVTDRSQEIIEYMKGTKRKIIVLDDFQYTMANEFMRRAYEKGYEKFTEIGKQAWDIFVASAALPADVRVYILSHTDTNDQGRIKIKTIGRMLDEKITPEGMVPIVLRCVVRDFEHNFSTRNTGDTVKTPMGMFADDYIPNDLALVDKAICEFWDIK